MPDARRARDIRTLVLLVALGLGLFGALTFAVTAACDGILAHSAFRLSRVATGGIVTDLLIVGHSRGANLLTAKDAGPSASVYNISYNGLGRSAILGLVRDFILKGNKASVVVVEVSGLAQDLGNCELKPYWGLLPELASAGARLCPDDATDATYFPPTRYNSEVFLRAVYYATLHRRSDQDWADQYQMLPALCHHYYRDGEGDGILELAPRNIADTRRALAAFETWMARDAPHTKIVYALAPVVTTPANLSDVRALAAAYRKVFGANFLDLSQALGGDCAAFANLVHPGPIGRSRIAPRVMVYARAAKAQDFRP